MSTHPPIRRVKPSEHGYVLVAVIFMLTVFMIALTVAAPKIAKSIQRDREVETMHRGKQYARAVKMYYKQFSAYPPNIDALVKTNEIRFLRRKYTDPMTGKDDWKPIRLGQNKVPAAMGFFGVPIGGVGMGGGLCGNALPNSTSTGSGSSSSTFGSSGSSFGSSGSSFGSSGSSFGSSGSSFGASGPATGGCPTDSSSSSSTSSSTGSTTDPNAPAGSTTDPNAGNGASQSGNGTNGTATSGSGTSTTGTGSSSAFGQPGQQFGGVGIMGFSPASPKQSILVYKKKNHYNEWEFVYDPVAEQMMMQQGGNAGGLGGTSGGTTGTGGINGGGSSTGPIPGGSNPNFPGNPGNTGGNANPGSGAFPQ